MMTSSNGNSSPVTRLRAICEGIHRSPLPELPMDPRKSQWRRGLMFLLVYASWTNVWKNSRYASDLRHHCSHYNDVCAMKYIYICRYIWLCCVLSCYGYTMCSLWIRVPIFTYSPQGYPFVTEEIHDDAIKWKHFPRNWPFVRGIHRSRRIPHTKASDAELWWFLWSASE